MVFPCEETSTGGELYFISSTHGNNHYIRASVFGFVSSSRTAKGWEVWRFVDSNRGDGTFFISPWTHSQFYLSSFPGGRVNTTRNQYSSELWQLQRETNGTDATVRIRSLAHDRFLQLEDDGHLSTIDPSRLSNKCWWNLESANSGKYYLHCIGRNKQLRCSKHNVDELPSFTESFEAEAVWSIQQVPDGDSFTIRSDATGWYLQSAPNSSQVGLSVEASGPDEGWYLTHHPSNNGSVMITSSSGGRLACSSNAGILMVHATIDDSSFSTPQSCAWKLVPKMPDTTSCRHVAAYTGVGVGSILLGIGTPYLVLGLLHSLGFTAHGIPAGSFAAKQMSRVAKQYGGSIPPGCWFATLQSIGVLGLGSTRFTLAFIGGCIFGAVIFRLILVCTGVLKQEKNPCASGIVASDNVGGILSQMDASIGWGSSRNLPGLNGNQVSSRNENPDAPDEMHRMVSEIVVHENNPTMDTVSAVSSRFADYSRASN